MPFTSTIDEASLPDLLLDLSDIYGAAFPKPQGNVIQFTLVDENTTYPKAAKKIAKILAQNGLLPGNVTITPGAEVSQPFNRKVVLLVPKGLLM